MEVKTTAGGNIISVVTQVGTAQNTIYNTPQSPVTSPWTSGEFFCEFQLRHSFNLDANASMPDDNSELTINLYIDGEIARTVKKKGKGYWLLLLIIAS